MHIHMHTYTHSLNDFLALHETIGSSQKNNLDVIQKNLLQLRIFHTYMIHISANTVFSAIYLQKELSENQNTIMSY